ncbi:unnamed protein product [Toxocara canis]|uniref:Keratin-associated protein 5-4-like n=1 Tax=Toxocara canis TaxID=6265 RepID=A0A183UP44_TOXCA|nr:unnamed protein product [Toxocara canis]
MWGDLCPSRECVACVGYVVGTARVWCCPCAWCVWPVRCAVRCEVCCVRVSCVCRVWGVSCARCVVCLSRVLGFALGTWRVVCGVCASCCVCGVPALCGACFACGLCGECHVFEWCVAPACSVVCVMSGVFVVSVG